MTTQLDTLGNRVLWSSAITNGVTTSGCFHDGEAVWILNKTAASKFFLQRHIITGVGTKSLTLDLEFDLAPLVADLSDGVTQNTELTDLHCLTGDGRVLYVAYSYEVTSLISPFTLSIGARITQVDKQGNPGHSYDVLSPVYPPQDMSYDGRYFYWYTKPDSPTTFLHETWDLVLSSGKKQGSLKQQSSLSTSGAASNRVWAFDYDGRTFMAFVTNRRGLQERSSDGAVIQSYNSTNIALVSGCFQRTTKNNRVFTQRQTFYGVTA